MRKLTAMLLFAVASVTTYAQINPYFEYVTLSKSDQIFNYPAPGKLKANFHFYFNKTTAITLELSSIKQLDHLPDLDALLRKAKASLKPFVDSLKQDGVVRRIDYRFALNNPQVRIQSHENLSNTYLLKEKDLVTLKIEQDTLRIKESAQTGNNKWFFTDGNYQKGDEILPFFITVTANNLSDIYQLPDNALQQCINRLKQELTPAYINSTQKLARYSAYYNMETSKMISPAKVAWIKGFGQQQELVPNIYAGLQFVRGSFVPSISAGLRYTFADRTVSIKHLFLMWEPHFFFSRTTINELITDRNDFLTLRFTEIETKRKEGFEFVNNVSIGYLVNRQGNWFDEKTFKVGIPGVRSGWFQLEPEFFFKNGFKNFSPSIKLTIHYE